LQAIFVTDYDIGVLPSEYQDYLKSMVGVQHDKTLKINTHKGLPCGNDTLHLNIYNQLHSLPFLP
jgi:hypothetical protein